MEYNIFETKKQVAKALAEELCHLFNDLENKKDIILIAISGGTTPFLLFEIFANEYKNTINWNKIHFFWVDERCVLPTSDESNFGNTKKAILDKIEIPDENIHRIIGENNPEFEAKRYSDEIREFVKDGIFDIILLGMGDDGHTASIFPHQIELMNSENIVEIAQNPYNFQNRITLTGTIINKAKNIYFLVTGANKNKILKEIFEQKKAYLKYPASYINPANGKLVWYFDKAAFAEELFLTP